MLQYLTCDQSVFEQSLSLEGFVLQDWILFCLQEEQEQNLKSFLVPTHAKAWAGQEEIGLQAPDQKASSGTHYGQIFFI